MQVVIVDELQQLFDLRDHKNKLLEKLNHLEAEYRSNMQLNAHKKILELHDLEVTHKVMTPYVDLKKELLDTDLQLEKKKRLFIDLLKASGSSKVRCSNKEWQPDGTYQYVQYILSLDMNEEGENDLLIEPERLKVNITI